MLQQTQTARVIPKYEAWLEAFPGFRELAAAPLSEALRLWSGLGYNRRGKWLWEAGRAVMERHGGRLPADEAALDALPGVGPYTARAVLAFAFGLPSAFIETNIRRVFIHFFFNEREGDVRDDEILPIVERTMDRDDIRSWYYALMDYGAGLPGVTPNPNRKSAAYTRQSSFIGSNREARGAILKALVAGKGTEFEEISRDTGIELERLAKAGAQLCAEGLIQENGSGGYTIA